MAQRTSTIPASRRTAPDWLVVFSALLLSGLAIADRTVAWMLGQFPTSAALWELRFEYLRPIGVFHDIAAQLLGEVGAGPFNIAAVLAALAVAFGAVYGHRLTRAVANHILLAAAVIVAVYSMEPGQGIYATVGAPSHGYLMIGLLLTAGAAFMCASSHCEYMGWRPASSRVARRAKDHLVRLVALLSERSMEALDQVFPAGRVQAILVRARRGTDAAR